MNTILASLEILKKQSTLFLILFSLLISCSEDEKTNKEEEPEKSTITLQLNGNLYQGYPFNVSVTDEDGNNVTTAENIQEHLYFLYLEKGTYTIYIQSTRSTPFKASDKLFSGSTTFKVENTNDRLLEIDVHTESFKGWVIVPNVPITPRYAATSFMIGLNIYIGFGITNETRYSDWWVYNIGNETWRQLNNFPQGNRFECLSFTLGTKGYIGFGIGEESDDKLKEFWEFNSVTETWTRIDDYPGSVRTGAIAMIIGGRAYVGTGANGPNSFKDFYAYDPVSQDWLAAPEFTGDATYYASAFVTFDIGHLVGGVINDTERTKQHYLYSSNSWSEESLFPGVVRAEAATFSLDNTGYFGMGSDVNNSYRKDFWRYKLNEGWLQLPDFIGPARATDVFGSNNLIAVGYYGFGNNGSTNYNDLYLYYPLN